MHTHIHIFSSIIETKNCNISRARARNISNIRCATKTKIEPAPFFFSYAEFATVCDDKSTKVLQSRARHSCAHNLGHVYACAGAHATDSVCVCVCVCTKLKECPRRTSPDDTSVRRTPCVSRAHCSGQQRLFSSNRRIAEGRGVNLQRERAARRAVNP